MSGINTWDVIDGTGKMSNGGGGSGQEIKLEYNEPKIVRPLLRTDLGEQPHGFYSHPIQNEARKNDPNGGAFYREIICPGMENCPVCKTGGKHASRLRMAMPVWDYSTQSVRILKSGTDLFKSLSPLAKAKQNIEAMNFIATKTGTKGDMFSTEYIGSSAMPQPTDVYPGYDSLQPQLPILAEVYAPDTVETMQAKVLEVGLNWEEFIKPLELEYPKSLKEALAHVMPNTKHKGATLEQINAQDPSFIDWLSTSKRQNETKACAQIIMVNLRGVMIDGVPNFNNPQQGTPVQQAPTATVPSQPITPQPTGTVATQTPPTQPQQTAPAATAQPQTQVGQPDTAFDKNQVIQKINVSIQSHPEVSGKGYQAVIDLLARECNGVTNIYAMTDEQLQHLTTFLGIE